MYILETNTVDVERGLNPVRRLCCTTNRVLRKQFKTYTRPHVRSNNNHRSAFISFDKNGIGAKTRNVFRNAKRVFSIVDDCTSSAKQCEPIINYNTIPLCGVYYRKFGQHGPDDQTPSNSFGLVTTVRSIIYHLHIVHIISAFRKWPNDRDGLRKFTNCTHTAVPI